MSGDHKTLIKGGPSQYVKLNIGGLLYYTTIGTDFSHKYKEKRKIDLKYCFLNTIGTLTKHDTMLRAMFSGRMEVLTDSEGKAILSPSFSFRKLTENLHLSNRLDTD